MNPTRIVERNVLVRLTSTEISQLQFEVADLQLTISQRIHDFQKQVEEYKKEMTTLNAKVMGITEAVTNGVTMTAKNCVEEFDLGLKKVRIFYAGQIIEERPLNDEDLQADLLTGLVAHEKNSTFVEPTTLRPVGQKKRRVKKLKAEEKVSMNGHSHPKKDSRPPMPMQAPVAPKPIDVGTQKRGYSFEEEIDSEALDGDPTPF